MCTTNANLLEKLNRRDELKKQINTLEYEMNEIDNFLKKEMETRGTDELIVPPFKVTYKGFISHRFDSKKFGEENPDEYKKYLTESVKKRFIVK